MERKWHIPAYDIKNYQKFQFYVFPKKHSPRYARICHKSRSSAEPLWVRTNLAMGGQIRMLTLENKNNTLLLAEDTLCVSARPAGLSYWILLYYIATGCIFKSVHEFQDFRYFSRFFKVFRDFMIFRVFQDFSRFF